MKLSNIDLNLLPVFAMIWSERNLSRAGERLHISQSAVSHALKRLRADFKDDLFVRDSNGVSPTDFAVQLAPRILSLLPHIEEIYASQEKFDPKEIERDLVLSVGDYFSVTKFDRFASLIQKQAPRVRLIFKPVSAAFEFEQFERGDLHLVISAINFQTKAGFHAKELFLEKTSVCSRAKNPRIEKNLSLASYLSAQHLIVSNFGLLYGQIDKHLETMKVKRKIGAVVASFFDAGRFLRASDLLLTAPHSICSVIAKDYGLEVYDLPFKYPKQPISMIWHERTHNDPFHAWVRKLMLSI